jgi:hypothetical protein
LTPLPVVLGTEAADRDAARAYLKPYLRTPTYRSSWELQGFAESDWEPAVSDQLLDAMVALGDRSTVLGRVGELHAAGADHVAIIPLGPDGTTEHLPTLEALA